LEYENETIRPTTVVFVGETLQYEIYHESMVFSANLLANVLTNKIKQRRKIHNSTQLNKPKQAQQANSDFVASFDSRSGNERDPIAYNVMYILPISGTTQDRLTANLYAYRTTGLHV